MKVFKFGGASVKDAAAVRNVANILKLYAGEKIVVVVSAMGKTTNALEKLTRAHFYNEGNVEELLKEIKDFHNNMVSQLFPGLDHPVYKAIETSFIEIDWAFEEENTKGFDYLYDQVVSQGELIATKIVAACLEEAEMLVKWVDARDLIKTDNTYREAKIDWNQTVNFSKETIDKCFEKADIALAQGFIGSTSENHTTTLGREGSDYSAAIFAYSIDAEEVIIWKDVPGVLNADPKQFHDTQKLNSISYQDAIELAYFGASVIHPKTIQPLQNKNIPLHVKSFLNPKEEGTLIASDIVYESVIPSYIVKQNQVLISIAAKDFSFIIEENLGHIFNLFADHKVKINLMQNSAISFSICIDNSDKMNPLIEELKKEFKVLYNENLQLFTIRHYNQEILDKLLEDKTLLLEQKSRHTAQLVAK
jgi:aspartate kinase